MNVTDGEYVYMRAPAHPENEPLYEYTLMPNQMRCRMSPAILQGMTLAGPLNLQRAVKF